MRTLSIILVAFVTILLSAESAAARGHAPSKTQVAANCLSMAAARRAWPSTYLKYRAVAGNRCWYAPGKQLVAKSRHPRRPPMRIASNNPRLPMASATGKAMVTLPGVLVVAPDKLDRVQRALCGGPCPRFDLDSGPDAKVYRALCGGPCPRFHYDDDNGRFDHSFEAFGLGR
jgi:hypothetical protein